MMSYPLAQYLLAPDNNIGIYEAAQIALRQYAARTYAENCREDMEHWQSVKMVLAVVPEIAEALREGNVTILEIAEDAKAILLLSR